MKVYRADLRRGDEHIEIYRNKYQDTEYRISCLLTMIRGGIVNWRLGYEEI